MDANESKNLQDLAAVFNGRQVTDDEGNVADETDTSVEKPAAPEAQTTVEESASAEKPTGSKSEDSRSKDKDTENELAEDETGKRYVPEDRFKEVYGKAKAKEREAEEYRRELEKLRQGVVPNQPAAVNPAPVDKTEALEIELLKGKLPQFDPESDKYSPELDQLGAEIFKANPGITRLEAARRAMNYAQKVAMKVEGVRTEARAVKSLQSDQGITSRVQSRDAGQPDFDKMSEAEIENYLRRTGQW
jgi:hypothetical protein